MDNQEPIQPDILEERFDAILDEFYALLTYLNFCDDVAVVRRLKQKTTKFIGDVQLLEHSTLTQLRK